MNDTWGRAYNRALARGDDHGYAAHVADKAERRAALKVLRDPEQSKKAKVAAGRALTQRKENKA